MKSLRASASKKVPGGQPLLSIRDLAQNHILCPLKPPFSLRDLILRLDPESLFHESGTLRTDYAYGAIKVGLNSEGFAHLTGYFHENGFLGENYLFAMTFLDATDGSGNPLCVPHEGSAGGTGDPFSSHHDNIDVSGFSGFIADNWDRVKNSRVRAYLHASTSFVSVVETILEAFGLAGIVMIAADPKVRCADGFDAQGNPTTDCKRLSE